MAHSAKVAKRNLDFSKTLSKLSPWDVKCSFDGPAGNSVENSNVFCSESRNCRNLHGLSSKKTLGNVFLDT